MTTTGINTLSTYEKRAKYLKSTIENALRNALVVEKICAVDRSDLYTIQNPYSTAPTATVGSLRGTYAVADYTITDDALTVAYEVTAAEHIYDFEKIISQFDVISNRIEEQAYAVAKEIDQTVLNLLCEAGTTEYSTPSGGFTTASNINTIIGTCVSKVAGYTDIYKGLFLVIENTDIPGFIQYGATTGFSFADAVLNNGLMTSVLGVDIYVVRTGTFEDASYGTVAHTETVTNSGHRVFGVKGISTYAAPRGVQYEEKSVSAKTGKEVVTWADFGFKLWTTKASLIVDITITS